MSFMGMNELLEKLKGGINRLDSGALAVSELEDLTEVSRELYERLVVLRYKAYDDSLKGAAIPAETQQEPIAPTVVVEKSVDPEPIKIEEPEAEEEKELEEESLPHFAFNIAEIKDDEVVQQQVEEMKAPVAIVQAPKPVTKPEQSASTSINDKLAKEESSLADRLGKSRIEDLRKAIGINQKFGLISGLFSGDSSAYDLAIDRFNSATDIEEAMSLFAEEQQARSWDAEDSLVESLMNLIERRHA